jgi:protein TonB
MFKLLLACAGLLLITTQTNGQNIKTPVQKKDSLPKQTIAMSEPNPDEIIFTKTEIEAQFPGGTGTWNLYLKKNLNASIDEGKGASSGIYDVVVRFIVARDGTVSEIEPQTHYGHGMENEVVRMIKKGPKWAPALQHGQAVRAYKYQTVRFDLPEQ